MTVPVSDVALAAADPDLLGPDADRDAAGAAGERLGADCDHRAVVEAHGVVAR